MIKQLYGKKIILLFILFSFVQKYLGAQQKLDFKLSEEILQDIYTTVDSVFKYKEWRKNNNFKGVRIIDVKNHFYETKGLAYFSDQTPFVIISKYPYNLNSIDYNDIIIIDTKACDTYYIINIFTLLFKSCDQIPINITKEYYVENGVIQKVKTVDINILDDWDYLPKD